VLTNDSGSIEYVPGTEYTIELEEIDGKSYPTGRFTVAATGRLRDALGSNFRLKFIYTVDQDVTHKISAISGQVVTLNNSIMQGGDTIEITYRYVPTSPDEIIRESIRVSNAPSSSASRIFYVEGTDFSIDSRNGTIQKLATGQIQGSVYVEFKHKNSVAGIFTFLIWAEILNENGVKIDLDLDPTTRKNKLVVDTAAGEIFFVNSPTGMLDISKALSIPVVGPGWVQFVVRSKNPDSNVAFRSNLIDQIIQLRDTFKKKIFKEGNSYFYQLTAFREPMQQKTLNHLKVNTLASDHTSFAIDDFTAPLDSYIVVNFKPTSTNELYCRVPTEDWDDSTRPPLDGETFLFTWNSKNQNIEVTNKVIVRIDLERQPTADGGLTPKVFGYNIRAST
jgi:hypothetical protein